MSGDGIGYDLPAVFGPSPFPSVTVMERVQSMAIPFHTTRDAAARLLPRWFEPPDDPIVSVSHTMNRGVDYMGGRGYNIVRVSVSAVFRGAEETITSTYAPVIWESDTAPIILGRERGGYAKIFGTIPDAVDGEQTSEFECREYDTTLISGRVDDWKSITGAALASFQQTMANTGSLAWKYIPGSDAEPDADYPVRLSARYSYTELWHGNGVVGFERPNAVDAPYSSHILAVLAGVPNLGYEPAWRARGSMELPRTDVRRLA